MELTSIGLWRYVIVVPTGWRWLIFVQARRRASLNELLSGLTGQADQLLPYAEIARQLEITNIHSSGLEQVPLEAIVGSVGRYGDFTRDFFAQA